jgi:hypothetical protein
MKIADARGGHLKESYFSRVKKSVSRLKEERKYLLYVEEENIIVLYHTN